MLLLYFITWIHKSQGRTAHSHACPQGDSSEQPPCSPRDWVVRDGEDLRGGDCVLCGVRVAVGMVTEVRGPRCPLHNGKKSTVARKTGRVKFCVFGLILTHLYTIYNTLHCFKLRYALFLRC